MHPTIKEVLDHAGQRGIIDLEALGQRGNYGGDDTR